MNQKKSSLSELILWAESPEEARVFIRKCKADGFKLSFKFIFVAKMSAKSRANNYVGGQYFTTSNNEDVDVFEKIIIAPKKISELVQWCTCDIMISEKDTPLVVLEDTTHIVRMNLFQRIPRIAKAATLGVHSIVLQGTQGINLKMRGDRWALYRYLQVFHSLATMHPNVPPLSFYYIPELKNEEQIQKEAFVYLKAVIEKDDATIIRIQQEKIKSISEILLNGLNNQIEIAPDIPSIQNNPNEVIVKIGANPDKVSWRTKGSDQMDPYLGMIVAAKYNYCYDSKGKQIKPLIVEFTHLPENFFFFKDREKSNSLYKRLAFELADKVIFCGKN